MTDSEKTVAIDHRHASNSVALPQLSDGVVIKLSPQDVTEVFRAVMDADREAALALENV